MKLTKNKETLIKIRLDDLCNELKGLNGVSLVEHSKATKSLNEGVDRIKFLAQKAA